MNEEQPQFSTNSPPTQTGPAMPMPELPQPHKSKKKILTAIIVLIAFMLGAGLTYFLTKDKNDSELTPQPDNQNTVQEPIDTADEQPAQEVEPQVFESKLYPDFSFKVSDGWEVSEPKEYDQGDFGPGWANGVITVSKGDIKLLMTMTTVPATGFEGYTCYAKKSLTKVGDIYRYEEKNGIYYENGVSQSDDEWGEASSGEYSHNEDSNPNFCGSFPFIGTYSSTLNQKDYKDAPYGFADNKKAMVWLSAKIEGSPSGEELKQVDEMIESRSDSAKIE